MLSPLLFLLPLVNSAGGGGGGGGAELEGWGRGGARGRERGSDVVLRGEGENVKSEGHSVVRRG